MPKELVITAAPHETRVAILEDGQLCEIYIEREKEFALVGSIYKGRVTRVLPGMQSAFVDIGLDSDAFLYVGDFFENLEDYDHVVSTVEGKVEKMEQQGGAVFPAPAAGEPLPPPTETPGAEEPSQPPVAPAPAEFREPGRPPVGSRPTGPGFNRDRGFDRGGRRRGGRWRRGRGGDRHGRDLPPSKYASQRPYTPRPHLPPDEEQPPADYEPVILPGESLAKYKDRIPPAPAASAEPAPPARPDRFADRLVGRISSPEEIAADLEEAPPASAALPEPEISAERPPEAPAAAAPLAAEPEPERATADYQAMPEVPPRELHFRPAGEPAAESREPEASASADMYDEVSSLTEQLAEARHEEATGVAEPELGAPSNGEEGEEEDSVRAAEEDEENGSFSTEPDAREESAAAEAAGEEEPGAPEAALEDERQPDFSSAEEEPSQARVSHPQRARFQRPMRRGGRHRGGRRHGGGRRPEHRPQFQRRPQLISEVLKPGQEIIVQIAKEPLGKKGARITSHVALPGRFLVYMPTVNHIGVSRRIASAEERSRLRRIVMDAKGSFPGGFIVRTAADHAPEEEIRSDVEFLGRTWEKIRAQAEPRKAPALLHRDLNLVERILRDYLSNDYTAIWIDNEEEYGKVVEFVGRFQPKLVSRVKLYTKQAPIFEEFGIQQDLDRALRPKVWLKSGGYIVINHTEALVAIDVNTGKYVGRGSTRLEDTIVKTNLEAVKEIVRQIRLRDLGGIIVLDFIDMEERRNRDKVMAALESALRADRAPSKVLAFNEFGLVAVTRKRTKQALERVLCQPCPYCTGSGMVKSVPTLCYEIQAEARKMAADLDAASLTLRVHPEIAKALKTRESALVDELEQLTRKSVIIQSDPTLHWEQYDIY